MTTILAEHRSMCRLIEQEEFLGTADITPEQQFRTRARMPWYAFCQADKGPIMQFKEFWGNDNTYQRTI